jgi:phospholipase C
VACARTPRDEARGPRPNGGPPGPRPQPGRPAGTDLLPQIRHIVVLMMENHSYDNYLGMLPGRGEGFPLAPDGPDQRAAFLDPPVLPGPSLRWGTW